MMQNKTQARCALIGLPGIRIMSLGTVPRDQRFTNFSVRPGVSTVAHAVSDTLSLPGGEEGDTLVNAGNNRAVWSSQLSVNTDLVRGHATDIQAQIKLNAALTAHISGLTAYLSVSQPIPTPPAGREILFQNNTSASTLDLYITEGYPTPIGATLLATLAPTGVYNWPIPQVLGWNGNFQVSSTGVLPQPGATLAEFGLNQLWTCPGCLGCLRDSFDISTVPPGLGAQLVDGPHSACTALSASMGYSLQQSRGYNVGITITPPVVPPQSCTPSTLATQTVTCNSIDGNSAGSVGYPNDTAYPKQQTGYAVGNYSVAFIDPVAL